MTSRDFGAEWTISTTVPVRSICKDGKEAVDRPFYLAVELVQLLITIIVILRRNVIPNLNFDAEVLGISSFPKTETPQQAFDKIEEEGHNID